MPDLPSPERPERPDPGDGDDSAVSAAGPDDAAADAAGLPRARDLLDPVWLRSTLIVPGSLWQRVEVVEETESTNADLVTAARVGERPGTVVVADHQSRGRGRRGRSWTAPPGTNVAMSLLVAPTAPVQRWTWLPLIAGLAVEEGLRRLGEADGRHWPLMLKWPNDVLADGQKLCGILAERVETPSGPACVIGIGINVHLAADELPVPTATSLRLLGRGTAPTRNRVVATVLRAFELLFAAWELEDDDSRFAHAYVRRCATIGRRVRVILADDLELHGVAEAVDTDGRLIVRTATGVEVVGAGDVVHVR